MSISVFLSLTFWVSLLGAGIRGAAPLVYAALGETVAEKAGLLNVGIEGMMTLGALSGFAVADWSGNALTAFLAAALVGALAGALFGVLTVLRGADQVVTGIVLNILALGLCSFGYDQLFGSAQNVPQLMTMLPLHVPWLSTFPVFGHPIFVQQPVVFIAFLMAPLFWLLLSHTRWGLNIRAVGENPEAVESAGLDVWRLRMQAIIIAGAFAGIGGAVLAVAQVGAYVDGMIAGRGFIALAVVVFGAWRPMAVAAAAVLFGTTDALQLRLQVMGVGISDQILIGLPYLLTIIVVSLAAGRAGYPAAINQPYMPHRQRARRLWQMKSRKN
jgi:simple sugar transport system permease protein